MNLGMGPAILTVPPFADDATILHHDRPNHGVRLDKPPAPFGQGEGTLHQIEIGHGADFKISGEPSLLGTVTHGK